jgi:ADP-ribose pyrophosphatase YjhB (NUDIX family)
MSKNTEKVLKVALALVKNSEGDILIVKRAKPEKGTGDSVLLWAFPGGDVASYATHEEALEEAVLGETGHSVSVGDLVNKRKHPQFPADVHYYACELATTETTQLIEDEEIEQISWVSPKELVTYFTSDFDKKVAKFLGA